MWLIAQLQRARLPDQTWKTLWLLGLILLLVIVVIIVGMIVYRRWNKPADDGGGGEAFTLMELRKLHRSGQLSDAEFERAKASMLARHLAATQGDHDPQAAPADAEPLLGPSDNAAAPDKENDP